MSNELLNRLLPGPVTLCFKRKPKLNPSFNSGSQLVGIRIPNNQLIREVCYKVQKLEANCGPIALTSANLSQSKSCLEVSEFAEELSLRPGSTLAMIFDGGRLGETEQSRLGMIYLCKNRSALSALRILDLG